MIIQTLVLVKPEINRAGKSLPCLCLQHKITVVFFLLPHGFANVALNCCTCPPRISHSLKFSLLFVYLLSFFLTDFIFFFPSQPLLLSPSLAPTVLTHGGG